MRGGPVLERETSDGRIDEIHYRRPITIPWLTLIRTTERLLHQAGYWAMQQYIYGVKRLLRYA